ncbi:hypothetical protein BpHYR1_009219 [Brachionus plicatilis]|uniref:Uncharacterized protein n=1 Tax=Brachionus plicatilis TaxID=10195 RepID=A0A3M7Q5K2_BRAPC|nr:hypothetical protein BpHYR1_009219 [Brachionus plicatilis]
MIVVGFIVLDLQLKIIFWFIEIKTKWSNDIHYNLAQMHTKTTNWTPHTQYLLNKNKYIHKNERIIYDCVLNYF